MSDREWRPVEPPEVNDLVQAGEQPANVPPRNVTTPENAPPIPVGGQRAVDPRDVEEAPAVPVEDIPPADEQRLAYDHLEGEPQTGTVQGDAARDEAGAVQPDAARDETGAQGERPGPAPEPTTPEEE